MNYVTVTELKLSSLNLKKITKNMLHFGLIQIAAFFLGQAYKLILVYSFSYPYASIGNC